MATTAPVKGSNSPNGMTTKQSIERPWEESWTLRWSPRRLVPNSSYSHPLQVCDSNHTHSLTSSQWSQLLANDCPSEEEKKCHCQKWRPHKARRLFSKLVHAKEERNGPPSANQGLSTAKLRSSHAVAPLPAGAEPKSQGHCHKWHHKLKICWLKEKQPLNNNICIHESSARYNRTVSSKS